MKKFLKPCECNNVPQKMICGQNCDFRMYHLEQFIKLHQKTDSF